MINSGLGLRSNDAVKKQPELQHDDWLIWWLETLEQISAQFLFKSKFEIWFDDVIELGTEN